MKDWGLCTCMLDPAMSFFLVWPWLHHSHQFRGSRRHLKVRRQNCVRKLPQEFFLESDSQNRFWGTIGSRVATIKFSFLHAVPGLGGGHTKSILGMQSWGRNYKWLSSKQKTNPARLTLAPWHASTARIGHFTVKISPFFLLYHQYNSSMCDIRLARIYYLSLNLNCVELYRAFVSPDNAQQFYVDQIQHF